MKKHCQLTALLMTALMCVSFSPATAFAEENEAVETVIEAESETAPETVMTPEEETEETETVIASEEGAEETEIVMLNAAKDVSSAKGTSASEIPADVLADFTAYAENSWRRIEKGADAELIVTVDIDEQYLHLLTYEWGYYKDQALTQWVKMASTNQPVYTVPSVTEMNEFYCGIYYGSEMVYEVSFTVTLENNFRAYAKDEQYVVKVKKGESAAFEVEVEGDDINGVTYRWWEDQNSPAYEWLDDNHTSTCVIPNVQENTKFTCVIYDGYGNSEILSFTATVDTGLKACVAGTDGDMKETKILSPGEPWHMAVDATCDPGIELTYTWYEDKYTTNNEPGWHDWLWVLLDGISGNEYTATEYIINPQEESTRFRCDVADSYGNKESIYFTAEIENGGSYNYKLVAWPAGLEGQTTDTRYLMPGEPWEMMVEAKQIQGKPIKYQWYKMNYFPLDEETGDYCLIPSPIEGATQNHYTCEDYGEGAAFRCEVKDNAGNRATVDFAYISESEHLWDTPAYEWAEDYISITATRVCKNNWRHVETETVAVAAEVNEAATCTLPGSITYTAAFTNDAFETQSRTEVLPPIGHDWQLTETREDGTQVYVCAHNENEVREVKEISVNEELVDNKLEDASGVTEVSIDVGENKQILRDSLNEVTRDTLNAQNNFVDDDTRETIYQMIEAGGEIEAVVEVSSDVSAEDIDKIVQEVSQDYQVAVFLDIEIALYDEDQNKLGTVNQLTDELSFTITVEPYDPAKTYYVFRMHDGEIERLETIDHKDGTLTFKTSRFSSYAVTTAKPSLADCEVKLDQTAYTYSGTEIKPVPQIRYNGEPLEPGTDYTVTYSHNVIAGTAELTVKGCGDYTGEARTSFKIAAASIAKATVTGISNKSYTGKAIKPVPTVKLGSVTLKSGTDYTVAYKNNTNPGKAAATITGKGNYSGTVSKTFSISVAKPAISAVTNMNSGVKITWGKVNGAAKYRIFKKTYSAGAKKWSSWAKLADTASTAYTDKKAVNGTTYRYTVRCLNGSGSYVSAYDTTGKTIACVTRPALISLTSPKTKQMLVKWGKNAKATGYVIQYSTSSKFASGNKLVTVKGAAVVSKAITGLTAKKTYYVRVRAYKTVGGRNYYSAWSAPKSVVTK